jgi:hypothetical protein
MQIVDAFLDREWDTKAKKVLHMFFLLFSLYVAKFRVEKCKKSLVRAIFPLENTSTWVLKNPEFYAYFRYEETFQKSHPK